MLSQKKMTLRRLRFAKGAFILSSTFFSILCFQNVVAGAQTLQSASSASSAQPRPRGVITAGTMEVSSTHAGAMNADFVGLSYELSTATENLFFTGTNTNHIALLKLLNPVGSLRIAQGSGDYVRWESYTPAATHGYVGRADLTNLNAFLTATGWKLDLGVNLGGSGPRWEDSPAVASTSTTLDADEVADAYEILGSNLHAIELGNEPDSFFKTYYPAWPNTAAGYTDFQPIWDTYYKAIVEKTPTARFIGPDVGNHTNRIASWDVPFLNHTFSQSFRVIQAAQHIYGPTPTSAASILLPDANMATGVAEVNAASTSHGIPWRMEETANDVNNNSLDNTYATSLYYINMAFLDAYGGAEGFNILCGDYDRSINQITTASPLSNEGSKVVSVNAPYYGLLLTRMAGPGILLKTTCGVSNLNVTCYAVDTGAAINFVIVNMDPINNMQMTITAPQTVVSATLMQLAQDDSDITRHADITIQGSEVGVDGSFHPNPPYILPVKDGNVISAYVPFHSAVLISARPIASITN